MDVTAALFTAAVTLGTLAPPSPEAPVPVIAAALPATGGDFARAVQTAADRTRMLPAAPERPAALVPLYVSLAVLQGLDIYSTSSALSRGGVEANPAMTAVSGSTWRSVAVKSATTAASVYFVERAWKHNRKGALILATAINVATAAVVAHNTRVARSTR